MNLQYSHIIKRANSQQASWPMVCFKGVQKKYRVK
jgi:hypothetical protein